MQLEGFLFDLDGTIYLGEEALPGAVATLAELRRRGKATLFVSNKPLSMRADYAAKLTRLGIPTRPEEVITSASVLGHHLATHLPHLRYYLIGEATLRAELQHYGLQICPEFSEQDPQDVIVPAGIDAIIVAFDRTLDYRKLNTAFAALQQGARFFATNSDKTCPMPGGSIPDAGATLAALEHISGRRVELVAGKPSPLIAATALAQLGLPAECCMMIGDRLETDIRMGQAAGMKSAVVLTGVTRREDALAMTPPPDLILERLDELLAWV